MARELNFTLEGVQGNLKLEYGPFKQRLYQDGREIKRQGRFNPKYHITNTNGEQEEIKIVYGLDFVHVAVFRGRKSIWKNACLPASILWVDCLCYLSS